MELHAILMSIEWASQFQKGKFLICSDSFSAVYSIKLGSSNNHQDLTDKLMISHSQVARPDSIVAFMWIPENVGIPGNEKVDKLVKQAIKRKEVNIDINLSKS